MTLISRRSAVLLFGGILCAFACMSCGKKDAQPSSTAGQVHAEGATQSTPEAKSSLDDPPPTSGMLTLPANFDRHTDDLPGMVKRRNIRALVVINPIGFFYDKGVPRGAIYEALEEFQRFVNKKLKSGTLGVKVTFIPVRMDQLQTALNEGYGDLVAMGVVITPEREKIVAFSLPLQTNISQIMLSGPADGDISTLEAFGGKQVWVNPLTTFYDNLKSANDSLKRSGKTPIDIKEADKSLNEDDLIQMVNGGLLPATVCTKQRAELWSKVLPNLRPHPEIVIASGTSLGWAMRKTNPQLKQLVDEFVKDHSVGTSFGSTVVRRYLQNTKWVTNSTSKEEMDKFLTLIAVFKRYAAEYNFDYLMLAAQGYQESMLNQDRRSPRGAVGIMQVMPKYAAAAPISIKNVNTADDNIHAAVKMLRNIAQTYFNDPAISPVDKTLFVFASYNAGPNRIVRLRKQAAQMGLNPNVWFDNVELVAAKDIGQETVTYVRNVYKYYVAYKLALQQQQDRRAKGRN